MKDKPVIVTLCGSTRFIGAFNDARQKETLKGKIVLSIEIVTTQNKWARKIWKHDPQHSNPETKIMLDELHLRKIDLSDEVLMLNVNGYIGESTRKELYYALHNNKKIRWLEEPTKDFLLSIGLTLEETTTIECPGWTYLNSI